MKTKLNLFFVMVLLGLVGCSRETLLRDLDEEQANEIVALLMEEGLDARKTFDKAAGYTVDVNPEDFARAVALTKRHNYPRPRSTSKLDYYSQSGFFPSDKKEKITERTFQEMSIARAIMDIFDGVINAVVHIAPGSSGAIPGTPQIAPTASVLIKYVEGSDVEIYEEKVRRHVANSVTGLSPTDVTVELIPAKMEARSF